MTRSEVRTEQQPDGTWTVYVRHVPVLDGLLREEAERRAAESLEDVVRGTQYE